LREIGCLVCWGINPTYRRVQKGETTLDTVKKRGSEMQKSIFDKNKS